MYNLLISLACGLAVSAGIRFGTYSSWAGWVAWMGSIVPGFLVLVGVFVYMGVRARNKLKPLLDAASKEAQAQKFDKAIQTVQSGFPLARWQFLVGSQLHSFLGQVLYIGKHDLDAAIPHLRKSFYADWSARTLLAAALYRKRELAQAEKVFESTAKSAKKEGLVWCVYAWCLEKEGRHDDAVRILGRGAAANPTDDKLKSALQSLQNGKKLKLGKIYGPMWFSYQLERIPPELAGPTMRGGRRVIYQRR